MLRLRLSCNLDFTFRSRSLRDPESPSKDAPMRDIADNKGGKQESPTPVASIASAAAAVGLERRLSGM